MVLAHGNSHHFVLHYVGLDCGVTHNTVGLGQVLLLLWFLSVFCPFSQFGRRVNITLLSFELCFQVVHLVWVVYLLYIWIKELIITMGFVNAISMKKTTYTFAYSLIYSHMLHRRDIKNFFCSPIEYNWILSVTNDAFILTKEDCLGPFTEVYRGINVDRKNVADEPKIIDLCIILDVQSM